MSPVVVQLPLFLLKTFGHLLAMAILLITGLLTSCIDAIGRLCAGCVASCTMANIEQDSVVLHTSRATTASIVYEEDSNTVGTDGPPQIVDEVATLTKSKWQKQNGNGQELLAKTKELCLAEFGSKTPDLLADDFQFIFPVVGPLGKDEFVEAFSSFKLRDAFPDSRGNYFNFSIDPLEPNRVWFFSRGAFTHTDTLNMGGMKIKASGKVINVCPQVLSMSFDEHGKCYKLTGGYAMDRSCGNTGGLGGVFGIVHALGGSLPFPEGKPWKPSVQWEAWVKRVPQIVKDFKRLRATLNSTSGKSA